MRQRQYQIGRCPPQHNEKVCARDAIASTPVTVTAEHAFMHTSLETNGHRVDRFRNYMFFLIMSFIETFVGFCSFPFSISLQCDALDTNETIFFFLLPCIFSVSFSLNASLLHMFVLPSFARAKNSSCIALCVRQISPFENWLHWLCVHDEMNARRAKWIVCCVR